MYITTAWERKCVMEFISGQFSPLLEILQVNFLVVLEKVVYTAFILILTSLILKYRQKLISRVFDFTRLDAEKSKTLESLLLSMSRYVIIILAVLTLLTTYNVDITPILASAGLVGLAIGFGAQNLVRDIITGFFITFEDQYHVGDFIEINNQVSGTVEELGLRLTTIREWSGKKFYIANSEVKTVRNYNRGLMRAIVSATVPFDEDFKKVYTALREACAEMTRLHPDKLVREEDGSFIEAPQVYGITDIYEDERGVRFTVIAVVEPGQIWFMEREFRRLIWESFKDKGITFAYPKRIIEERKEQGRPTKEEEEQGEQ